MPTSTPISYRKKLIEVALPLEAINKESARRSRFGTGILPRCTSGGRGGRSRAAGRFSSLRWWMIRILIRRSARPMGRSMRDRAGARRAELFNLIEELSNGELHNDRSSTAPGPRSRLGRFSQDSRHEGMKKIRSSWGKARRHTGTEARGKDTFPSGTAWSFVMRTARPEHVNAFLAEHAPPVLDPFCGGGSIPLEAQRLGCATYASDLNPVPVLITKALIEIPPKFANSRRSNPAARKQGTTQNM